MTTPEGKGRFIPNSGDQVRQFAKSVSDKPFSAQSLQGQQAARRRREARANKTKIGGFNPTVSVNIGKGAAPAADANAGGSGSKGTPGGDFMSNEDIRTWCEHVRKQARNRAVERSMDAEQLQAVLRHIPTSDGSMGGALMRARRVSRHLRRIARAEQVIAKAAAAAYAQFEREYEAELRKVARARPQQPAARFSF